jgi:branched-chain amino acid aminotransferase
VIVTPELTGSLLAGVTRDSILRLARDAGFGAEERQVSVDEWETAAREGRMTEAFACGTAAVITPIGGLKSALRSWTMGDGKSGAVTTQLREMLVNIQYGRAPDKYGWMHTIL